MKKKSNCFDLDLFRKTYKGPTVRVRLAVMAKKRVKYDSLSPEGQQDFDMDPFGFAYDGDLELFWETATLKD